MSGLNRFTLAHSGLQGSLHTLDGLPYVGPPNVRYDMVVTPLSTGLSPARFGALVMAHINIIFYGGIGLLIPRVEFGNLAQASVVLGLQIGRAHV